MPITMSAIVRLVSSLNSMEEDLWILKKKNEFYMESESSGNIKGHSDSGIFENWEKNIPLSHNLGDQ